MTTTTTTNVLLFLLLLLAITIPNVTSKRVKIYLLLGQSNMYGAGKIDHLQQLKNDYQEYFDDSDNNNEFKTRSDVRIVSSQVFGIHVDFPPEDLTVGASMLERNNRFGPEIGFGWTVGDNDDDDDILLIKCAFGGTHLGVEWRSPSAPPIEYFRERDGTDPFHSSSYGSIWNLMKLMTDLITSNISHYVPTAATNDDFEIAGIVWMQGWNDAFNYPMRDDYEINLSYFIQDLQDLYGNDVPILIAELGQEGAAPKQESVAMIRQAQISAVEAFARRTIVFVPTSPYVINVDEQPNEETFDGIHHYYGRADTVMEIGKALGREMIRVSAAPAPSVSAFQAPPKPAPAPSPTKTPKNYAKLGGGGGGAGGK